MPEQDPLQELHLDRTDREGGGHRGLWLALVVMVMGAIGAAVYYSLVGQITPVETSLAEAPAAGPAAVLDATGYVIARRQATVSSKISGKLAEVLIEEGIRVEADQLLARLDDTDAKAQLDLAKARLAASQARLAEIQVQLEQARRGLRRQTELRSRQLASDEALETATTQVETLSAQLEAQRSQVRVSEAEVQVAQVAYDNTVVRAPFAGVIVAKAAQPGEIVSPMSAGGGFTRTGIGTIVDMDSLEIEVDVNEAFINRVRPEQPVQAVLDAYPDWRIPASVIAIIPTADRSKATMQGSYRDRDKGSAPGSGDGGPGVFSAGCHRGSGRGVRRGSGPRERDTRARRRQPGLRPGRGSGARATRDLGRRDRGPACRGAGADGRRTGGPGPAAQPGQRHAGRTARRDLIRTPAPMSEPTLSTQPDSSGTLVAIRGVSKVYERGRQRIEVLHRVDLDIPKGDFLALMGPSGSGKSTLLNMIAGLDLPTEGTLSVAGRRIDRLSATELARWRAANVGFVFQFYNLLPALSAQKNVELPLLLTRLSAARRRRHAALALALVGLADRASHRPSELSGGQQQRVAIARAIVSDPTLLVCDEPTGDLDRHSAEEVLTLLQRLNRDYGKTMIMVTHDPKAAEFARRILHLDKGVLVEQPSSDAQFPEAQLAGCRRRCAVPPV
jgi:putative ABC transport system ATP-binding protein